MILYQLNHDYLRLVIFERKGNKNAYFPFQRRPHLVGQFYFHGMQVEPARYAIHGQPELEELFQHWRWLVSMM